jgi:hypothetical protein
MRGKTPTVADPTSTARSEHPDFGMIARSSSYPARKSNRFCRSCYIVRLARRAAITARRLLPFP